MNRKQLIGTLAALLVIGLSIYFMMKKDSSSWNSNQYSASGEKMFADLDLNKITSITVSSAANTASIRKSEDGSWALPEKDSYPADFKKIADFLKSLPDIKTVQNVNVGKSQLGKLCLGDEDKGKGAATLVELGGENGGKLVSLLIGKKHVKKEENPNPYFGGAFTDGSYVMLIDGKSQPKLVNNSFDNVSADAIAWADRTLFSIDNISSAEVVRRNPEESWKMAKDAKTGKLAFSDLKEDESMDEGKLYPFGSLLKYASFKDVRKCPADFTGDTAKIEAGDGFKYEIRFSPKEGDAEKYLVNVSASASIPGQREIGKDEKPEDKDKLDKEFKEKTEKLKEKLEHEKSLGKWLYTMSKSDISSLLGQRKDFLKVKEEKKEGAPKEAEPVNMPATE